MHRHNESLGRRMKSAALHAFALALAVPAMAVEYVDIEKPNKSISPGLFGGYIGYFDIVNPGSSTFTINGYSSGNGTFSDYGGFTRGSDLLSATASFYFADDNDNALEKVDVYIGLFDGVWNVPLENKGETTINFGASTLSLAILETLGGIEYVVKSESGDFKLKYALLTASSAPHYNNVPDGGSTLLLLGTALLGMVGIQRRLQIAR